MRDKKGTVGMPALVGIILAVLVVSIVGTYAIFHVSPTLGGNTEEILKGTILSSAHKCQRLDPINVSQCAEGSDCNKSYGYTDYSTYSVNIPTLAVYCVNVTLKRDYCWADNHTSSDWADNASNNSPEFYDPDVYRKLTYQFKIGDEEERHEVIENDNSFVDRQICFETLDSGTYNLKWRIVTDWDNSTVASGENRTGVLKDNIKLYCVK